MRPSKKGHRAKDPTAALFSGRLDDDEFDARQSFGQRQRHHQKNKTAKTALQRQSADGAEEDLLQLPVGRVLQVHSASCDVESDQSVWRCITRKTLASLGATRLVVGDAVRFSLTPGTGPFTGVIEHLEPRRTILSRADVRSGNGEIVGQIPIIANADNMLIVTTVLMPRVKWGLVDRMIVAAKSGGLRPIVCLNKVDLARHVAKGMSPAQVVDAFAEADEVLGYYQRIGIDVLRCSAIDQTGLEELSAALKGRVTVLAGHSGVGKSSLIRSIEPSLDIRVGAISNFHQKGTHTTTSARWHPLSQGGAVIDTPGVKLFGIWNVTADDLPGYFPDLPDAPEWRRASYERILSSLSPGIR